LAWQRDLFFQGVTPPSARALRQQARRDQQIARVIGRRATLDQRIGKLQAQQAERQTWRAQREADNASGSTLAPIVIRLDAGFATDANLVGD